MLFVFNKPILLVFSHITLYFIHEYILLSFISGTRKTAVITHQHSYMERRNTLISLYLCTQLSYWKLGWKKRLAAFRKMHLIQHQEFRTQKYKKLLYNLLSHDCCPLLWLKNCSISSFLNDSKAPFSLGYIPYLISFCIDFDKLQGMIVKVTLTSKNQNKYRCL